MPEYAPSLSEIENVNADPERGSGEPAVVYDDRALLNQLNQNAQLNQQNQWRRYQQFLNDYETRLKTRQDIADIAVADSDREYLKKQATDLFKTALDDPYKIYSPEFNSKLGQIKADATSSKMARDFAEKNLQWIVAHPELNTEENRSKITDYLDNQTVEDGGRGIFTLDMPDIFDMEKFWGGIMEDPRVKATENVGRIDEAKRLRYDRTDTKYLLNPFLKAAESTYDIPQIKKRADKMYSELPDNIKRQFPTAKDFWVNLGAKYFGSDKDIVRQGKENVDAYNAPAQKADEAIKRGELAVKWADYDLKKKALELKNKSQEEKNTWLNDFVNGSINNALINGKKILSSNSVGQTTLLRKLDLSSPTLELFAFKQKDENGKDVTRLPDEAGVTDDGKTIVFNYYTEKTDSSGNPIIDEAKTKRMSKEEFKARAGKDLLGVKALSDEIYPYNEDSAAKPSWAE